MAWKRFRWALRWSLRNYLWTLTYVGVLVPLAYWAGLPVFHSLDRALAHRPAAEQMFPGMRAMYFFQWLHLSSQEGTWSLTFAYLLGLGLVLWLGHMVWSGGILGLVYQGSYRVYTFRATVRAGWHLLPRQLLAWPVWLLIAAGTLGGAGSGLLFWLRQIVRSQRDAWFVPALVVSGAVWALLVVLVSLLWDLTRIEAIRSGYWALAAALRSAGLLLRRLPHYLGIAIVYALLGSGIWVAGAYAQKGLMQASIQLAVHAGWLIYLISVWGRIVARIGLWLHLADEFHQRDIEMARPEGLEPPTW